MKCNALAFINNKGGCGKTTSIYNVAGVLADKGEKVLVIDLDKQHNTTDLFLWQDSEQDQLDAPDQKFIYDALLGKATFKEITFQSYWRQRGNASPRYYGVDVIPSCSLNNEGEDALAEVTHNLEASGIKKNLQEFLKKGGYTWLLVDMPPANRVLNDICFGQMVDYVIVPFSSDMFSMSGYGDIMDTINNARLLNPQLHILGIYLSRYFERCQVDEYIRSELRQFKDVFIDIQIPMRTDIRETAMFNRPISFYKFTSPSKIAYEKLVKEMVRRINKLRQVRLQEQRQGRIE